MSDQEQYVQPPIDVGNTTPMVLANEPPKEEESKFESSPEGLREASESRVERTPEPEVIRFNDSETGLPRPANETLSAERAAVELAGYRNSKADQQEAQSDAATRELIDRIQANAQNPDLQPQAVEQQQQPQQQPAPQPAQTAQQTPGHINPELVRAMENPAVREAVGEAVREIESAKQNYVEIARQNAQVSAAALFAAYPELQNIPGEQIKGAIAAIANQNPARGAEIVAHIERTNAVVSQWQQAAAQQQAQQQARAQQEFAAFAAAEDAKFLEAAPEMADKQASRKLGDAAVSTLRNVGFSDADLQRAYNGEASLSLRDHRAQLLLRKASLYDLAIEGAKNAQVRTAPPVVRPGVSGERAAEYDQSHLSELSRRLGQTGNAKDAARLLMARRANRG
jgi:hypothetical protein